MTTLEQIGGWADIPVEVEAEIDRKLMTVRQVLQLDAGSIVRLSRSAGDTINVLVGVPRSGRARSSCSRTPWASASPN